MTVCVAVAAASEAADVVDEFVDSTPFKPASHAIQSNYGMICHHRRESGERPISGKLYHSARGGEAQRRDVYLMSPIGRSRRRKQRSVELTEAPKGRSVR